MYVEKTKSMSNNPAKKIYDALHVFSPLFRIDVSILQNAS